jgi:hypothetical protein
LHDKFGIDKTSQEQNEMTRVETAELQQAAEILKGLGGKAQLTEADAQTAKLTLAYSMGFAEAMEHIAPGEFLKLVGRVPVGRSTGHPNVLQTIAADLESVIREAEAHGTVVERKKSLWRRIWAAIKAFFGF